MYRSLPNTITERYKPLPYPVCQLLFVSMTRELLDDYRVRLVQLRKEYSPISHEYTAIMNTAHFILLMLADWVDQPVCLSAVRLLPLSSQSVCRDER